MAVTALRGYDPTTLAWKKVPASTPEDSVPPTDIVDDGLFTVMTLRKRRQQSNTAKASDTDKAKSAKTPPKKTSRVSWRPAAMPRTAAEDFTIVLKPRVTVDLKAAFQPGELGAKLASYANATNSDCIRVWPIWAQNIIVVSTNDINTANLISREFSLKTSQGPLPMIGHAKISGEVCRGVITVHEQETSASLKAKIHWRGGNIAFIRKLGDFRGPPHFRRPPRATVRALQQCRDPGTRIQAHHTSVLLLRDGGPPPGAVPPPQRSTLRPLWSSCGCL
ncbi:hypothetical protein HPB49_005678 [Dermacentor silvarum]|uniref:Uncharacterized protein n=1 Tax=Dermacentor silvarum TaxID=543639 RepID=A0ACB8C7G9_DERSI|nr:hypothetical protein HPB49_005678 [Dermacentor silvarum]